MLREAQAIKPQFQADHHAVGTGLAQGPKHVSGAASHFEDPIALREFRDQLLAHLENQMIARLKPEMAVFDLSQLLEKRRIVSAGRFSLERGLTQGTQFLDRFEVAHDAIAVFRAIARNWVTAETTRA